MINNTFDFKIPNLDDVECNSEEYHKTSYVLQALADYTFCKGSAIAHRRDGNIDTALYYERECDRLYKTLPDWAKW